MSAAPADIDDTDDIFRDRGPPLGSDPFALNEAQIVAPPANANGVVGVANVMTVARLGLCHDLAFTEILTHAAAFIAAEAGGTRALFFEFSPADGSMSARCALGFTLTEGVTLKLESGEGFVGFAAQSHHTAWSGDARGAEAYFQWLADSAGVSASRAVTVPVLVRERCFGAIEIYDPTAPRDEALDARLTVLADAAALAIETRLLLAQYGNTVEENAA